MQWYCSYIYAMFIYKTGETVAAAHRLFIAQQKSGNEIYSSLVGMDFASDVTDVAIRSRSLARGR